MTEAEQAEADRAARKAARLAALDAPISRERIAQLRAQDEARRAEEQARQAKVISPTAEPKRRKPAAPEGEKGGKPAAPEGEKGGKSSSERGEMMRRWNQIIALGWWAVLSPPELRVMGWVLTKCDWKTCRIEMSQRLLARNVVACSDSAKAGIDRLVERGLLRIVAAWCWGHGTEYELTVPKTRAPETTGRKRGGLGTKSPSTLHRYSGADCTAVAVQSAREEQDTLHRCSGALCTAVAEQDHVLHGLHPPTGGETCDPYPPDGSGRLEPPSPPAEENSDALLAEQARAHRPTHRAAGGTP